MIHDIKITPLKIIPNEKGKVMHMLRKDSPVFSQFGEIYFSCAWPGVVKGWHAHKSMTVNNAVIVGHAKLVLYDIREGSPSRGELMEIFLGEDNYVLVQIPPGIMNGYKAFGTDLVIMANCATEPHDPNEISYIDPHNNDIPYDWNLKEK